MSYATLISGDKLCDAILLYSAWKEEITL